MIAPADFKHAQYLISISRDPETMKRSAPFIEGMTAGVAWALAGNPRGGANMAGYATGSVELDAWLSGFDAAQKIADPAKENACSPRHSAHDERF